MLGVEDLGGSVWSVWYGSSRGNGGVVCLVWQFAWFYFLLASTVVYIYFEVILPEV